LYSALRERANVGVGGAAAGGGIDGIGAPLRRQPGAGIGERRPSPRDRPDMPIPGVGARAPVDGAAAAAGGAGAADAHRAAMERFRAVCIPLSFAHHVISFVLTLWFCT
jgi:hypothetical protein